MNIGEKIKRIRQHRRMTQKELGELVDSAQTALRSTRWVTVIQKAPAKSDSRGFACFPVGTFRWR